MRWRDHRRITLEACKLYNIKNYYNITEASILPDRKPDYQLVCRGKRTYKKRVPHHENSAIDIAFKHLKDARIKYKENSNFSESLGRALHYLQDYSVDPTKKLWIFTYRSSKAHDIREKGLSRLPINPHTMVIAKNQLCLPHEFKGVVRALKKGKTPEEIMEIGSYLTSLALKLTVNPEKPDNLKKKYKKAATIHITLIVTPLILTFLFVGHVTAVIPALLISYILHKLDFNYSKWKINYNWF